MTKALLEIRTCYVSSLLLGVMLSKSEILQLLPELHLHYVKRIANPNVVILILTREESLVNILCLNAVPVNRQHDPDT